MRVDIRRALALLPRCNKPTRRAGRTAPPSVWGYDQKFMLPRFRVTTKDYDRKLNALMRKAHHLPWYCDVQMMDVTKPNVWTIQTRLRAVTMDYLTRNDAWAWQRWAKDRLPIYLLYDGRVIIWNGTHRSTLGMLTGKKIRGRVYDLDAMVKHIAETKKVKRRG